LKFTEGAIAQNPKSYWVWLHRTWITSVMSSCDWKRELGLCGKLLELDERNFHCWNYRRYAAEKAKATLVEEFQFTTKKIEQNFSNYSAWHQRSALIPLIHKGDNVALERALEAEFEYVKNAFYTEPSDQSIWIYHRWLVDKTGELYAPTPDKYKNLLTRELEMCDELLQVAPDSKWALHTGMFLMVKLGTKNYLQQIEIRLKKLTEVDPDRREYYTSLHSKFVENANSL